MKCPCYCDEISTLNKSSHTSPKNYISALIDGGVNINTIRALAQSWLRDDDFKTLMELAEVAVRWARQWMKTATGEEKKAKVAGYLLRKAQALGLNVDEEDIDKVIEAVYDKIKNEKWEDAAAPPLEAE